MSIRSHEQGPHEHSGSMSVEMPEPAGPDAVRPSHDHRRRGATFRLSTATTDLGVHAGAGSGAPAVDRVTIRAAISRSTAAGRVHARAARLAVVPSTKKSIDSGR